VGAGNHLKADDVIDIDIIEQAFREKPVPTFSQHERRSIGESQMSSLSRGRNRRKVKRLPGVCCAIATRFESARLSFECRSFAALPPSTIA
jgi:hypothetical protein